MERIKTRYQRKTERYITEFNSDSKINFYLFSIYASEFYKGDWETLAYDWDIKEVINLENLMLQYQDMLDAMEADRDASEAKKNPEPTPYHPQF